MKVMKVVKSGGLSKMHAGREGRIGFSGCWYVRFLSPYRHRTVFRYSSWAGVVGWTEKGPLLFLNVSL